MGTKVVGIDVLYNVRSRNVQVTAKRVKPNTRYFVFMENTDLTPYAVPKYLPITMSRGTFAVNDIVESSNDEISGNASIKFRVASPNHKNGPYNNPSETVTILPFPNISVPTAYSSTRNIKHWYCSLGLQNNIENIGYVKKGMKFVNHQELLSAQ